MMLLPSGFNSIFTLGGPHHEIMKVTLRSGETFSFDITGAQYGYPEPITPWKTYHEERVLENIKTSPAPHSKDLIQVAEYSLAKMIHFYNDGSWVYHPKQTCVQRYNERYELPLA